MQQPSEQFEEESVYFTDFSTLLYPPKFAADCFGLTTRRLQDIEDENGLEIRRIARGTVPTRAYTLSDIFDIAAIRRSKGQAKGLPRQGKLISLVRQVLEETGLDPQYLELELTESQLLDSVEHIISTFQQLRDLGVKLAIDDFGTGYSSLSYLKRIPVDYVKIDQTFIRGLGQGREDASITRAIIAMAHGLSLKVVAEGVEDQQQLDFLRDEQCDEVQGYLISRPVEADGLADLLRKNADFP